MKNMILGGITSVLILITGCGSSSSLSPANQQVCAHLRQQATWFRGVAQPNLSDLIKVVSFLAIDAGEADGKLKKDLRNSLASFSGPGNSAKLGTTVRQDCNQ